MVINAFFAFLHFVAVFGIFATIFGEWLLLSRAPTYVQARQIQLCDRWYGIFSAVVLVIGFLRVFYFEKGKAYYAHNGFFLLKFGIFIVVGALSLYPTIRFVKWRKETKLGLPPIVTDRQFAVLRTVMGLEVLALLAMAMCASLMARGVTF